MSEQPMTPRAASIRLAQYGERTSTWATATHDGGTERALHEIALTLNAEVERLTARVAELEDDSSMLNALYAAGVDNWEGYDVACEGR